MSTVDYLFQFQDICNGRAQVSVTTPQEHYYHTVVIDDTDLYTRRTPTFPAILADLLDFALAVAITDRLVPHYQEQLPRRHVVIPLRCPDCFMDAAIQQQLQHILHWFTGADWTYTAIQRQSMGRDPELQQIFPLEGRRPVAVALWSGGLDALAGVYRHLCNHPSQPVTLCSSTNGNRRLHGMQRTLWKALQQQFPDVAHTIKLQQIALRIQNTNDLFAKKTNSVPRARGFLFLCIGTVSALLEGQRQLLVYENGIGAINLACYDSAVNNDQSRSVHPISLFAMSQLISQLIGRSFVIRNPYMFFTKAALIQPLIEHHQHGLIAQSISCDKPHRHHLMQCGWCSSCILRRYALLVHGWRDDSYVVCENQQKGVEPKQEHGQYLRAMDYHVERLAQCVASDSPWQSLAGTFSELVPTAWSLSESLHAPVAEVQDRLVQVYHQYVMEWKSTCVRDTLAVSLLSSQEWQAMEMDTPGLVVKGSVQ